MTSTDYVAQFNETLAQITQPLVQQYNDLDREIADRETEINSMRKARTQLRQMLRSINPELVPAVSKNGKKKKSGSPHDQGTNEANLQQLTDWMQARREEINAMGGVHASGLVNGKGEVTRDDWDVPFRNQSKLSHAMRLLHERGILRFDHTGNGGAKFYKVV